MKKEHKGRKKQNEREDAEYIALLRDIEPAGATEFSDVFNVSPDEARRRLEKLHQEDNPPVARKNIDGAIVWTLNEPGIDTRTEIAMEEVRRRLGVDEKQ